MSPGRWKSITLAAVALLGCASTYAQTPAADKPYTPPRLANGKPDLQGVWANNTATPLERPKMLDGRALLTDQEVVALQKRYAEIFAGDGDAAFGDSIFEAVLSEVQKYKPTTFDASTGNYNAFWLVAREFDKRTSLITDPADGRMPALTPDGTRRRNEMIKEMARMNDGPEGRNVAERCITFGVPDLLAGYNSYYQIVQGDDAIVFYNEKIHDARVIRLTTQPHPPAVVRTWVGDSRGRWEGDTLVVETSNLRIGVAGSSENVKLTERFTRVGPNTLNHEITFNDPATWTRPWTLMIPLRRTNEQIYEYACHEGNSSMSGMLAGARVEEAAKTAPAAK